MTKTQIQQLSDYLQEPNPINLRLFVLSVNQNAVYKKAELLALINKYKLDNSKLRLTAIENYLQSVKSKSVKSTKNITYLPKTVNAPELEELNELKRKYQSNMHRQGNANAIAENQEIRNKIDDLESKMGIKYEWDKIPPEGALESKKSIMYGVLGDYENPESIAWELLNGSKTYFEIGDSGRQNTAGYGMTGLIDTLQEISGKKIRPFHINFVFPQGVSNAKAKWTFSLSPQMSSVAMMTQTLQGYNSELGNVPR